MEFRLDLERGKFPEGFPRKAIVCVAMPRGTPIGRILYFAREFLGLSQEFVSSQLQISQKKISRIERGESMEFEPICQLVLFYGLSLDDFVRECVE
jgi:DNA-binding XRE family transcriptional regulator